MLGFHLLIDSLRIFVVMKKKVIFFDEIPYGSYVVIINHFDVIVKRAITYR